MRIVENIPLVCFETIMPNVHYAKCPLCQTSTCAGPIMPNVHYAKRPSGFERIMPNVHYAKRPYAKLVMPNVHYAKWGTPAQTHGVPD